MKLPKAVHSFELTPYPVTLHLYTNPATYCRAVNRNRPSETLGLREARRTGGACSRFGEHVLVGVFSPDASVLVHELTHALEHVIDHVGLSHGFDNNEPAAYLMQRMYRECIGSVQG